MVTVGHTDYGRNTNVLNSKSHFHVMTMSQECHSPMGLTHNHVLLENIENYVMIMTNLMHQNVH